MAGSSPDQGTYHPTPKPSAFTTQEQRAQDPALQAYLDQMSTLLLEKDLRNSEEDSEVRTLARARTLTVLERLDPSRKEPGALGRDL